MFKPQIYQHFTCPKSNNSFGPYYKILPHCFRAQLSEIIILTKYNNLYENLHAKSNRCLCRRGKPDGIGLNWIFTKRCLFYFTYIFLCGGHKLSWHWALHIVRLFELSRAGTGLKFSGLSFSRALGIGLGSSSSFWKKLSSLTGFKIFHILSHKIDK